MTPGFHHSADWVSIYSEDRKSSSTRTGAEWLRLEREHKAMLEVLTEASDRIHSYIHSDEMVFVAMGLLGLIEGTISQVKGVTGVSSGPQT